MNVSKKIAKIAKMPQKKKPAAPKLILYLIKRGVRDCNSEVRYAKKFTFFPLGLLSGFLWLPYTLCGS